MYRRLALIKILVTIVCPDISTDGGTDVSSLIVCALALEIVVSAI